MQISFRNVKAANEVFKRLNNLRRWTSIRTTASFDELSKQSLNSIVSYMLACYSENAGRKVDLTKLPKLALYRSYAKTYVYFDTPTYIINQLCELGNIKKESFEAAIKNAISKEAGSEFADFLCEALHSYEERLFKAAREITTFVELNENKVVMDRDEYWVKVQELMNDLATYADIPGVRDMTDVNGPLFKILLKLASLRNQNRWAFLAYHTECSVLGHLFDTAGFAYLMSLEKDPNNEEKATNMFFLGVYHDIAEAWTTDIPSPVKDGILGFRKVTEQFEKLMLEKHLYSQVPEFLQKKLRKVMMEDDSNKKVKSFIKSADYLSADSECWRQYVGGTNESYYLDVIRRDGEKFQSGELPLTPACEKLYLDMLIFAEKVTANI